MTTLLLYALRVCVQDKDEMAKFLKRGAPALKEAQKKWGGTFFRFTAASGPKSSPKYKVAPEE